MWSLVWNSITSWHVVELVGVSLVLLGFSVLSMTPPEVRFAIGCFSIGYSIILARLAWWVAFERAEPIWERALFIIVLFAATGALWFLSSIFAESKQQKRTPAYAAGVGPVFSNSGLFWAVYNAPGGKAVAPIDSLVGIRIVNLQSVPVSLTSVTLDMRTPNGWMPLRRIPLENVRVFAGPLESAGALRFEPDNIRASLVNSEIGPGRTIRGMGIYEYSDTAHRTSDNERSQYRITITDTANRKEIIEISDKLPNDDPYSNTEEQAIIGGEEPHQDLTKLPLRRYLPPAQGYGRK